MNKNTNESWNYAKYRTFCVLSEETIREYSVQSKWKQTDELYEKVKQKIMKLSVSEVEKKIEQMNFILQNILDDKELTFSPQKVPQTTLKSISSKKNGEFTKRESTQKETNSFYVREHVLGAKEESKKLEPVKKEETNSFYVRERVLGAKTESKKTEPVKQQSNSSFFVRENVLGAKETFGTEKKDYNAKILELMKWTYRTYSKNLKQDVKSLQRVRMNFQIPSEIKIYYVFDWTLLGNCKEGLVICSDGLHYRFDATILTRGKIEWKELSQYDIQLYGPSIRLHKKDVMVDTFFYFLQKEDAYKFIDVLHKMQQV